MFTLLLSQLNQNTVSVGVFVELLIHAKKNNINSDCQRYYKMRIINGFSSHLKNSFCFIINNRLPFELYYFSSSFGIFLGAISHLVQIELRKHCECHFFFQFRHSKEMESTKRKEWNSNRMKIMCLNIEWNIRIWNKNRKLSSQTR